MCTARLEALGAREKRKRTLVEWFKLIAGLATRGTALRLGLVAEETGNLRVAVAPDHSIGQAATTTALRVFPIGMQPPGTCVDTNVPVPFLPRASPVS